MPTTPLRYPSSPLTDALAVGDLIEIRTPDYRGRRQRRRAIVAEIWPHRFDHGKRTIEYAEIAYIPFHPDGATPALAAADPRYDYLHLSDLVHVKGRIRSLYRDTDLELRILEPAATSAQPRLF